ncbi:TPA: hypothetical protein N0F65_005686, partial [Lagenidium giganteum]
VASLMLYCALSAIAVLLVVVWRVWSVIIPDRIKSRSYGSKNAAGTAPLSSSEQRQVRTMVVLGSGGHTTEMLKLIKGLNRKIYTPITFVIAATDKTSQEKTTIDWKPAASDSFLLIPRSREVGQSWSSTVWTTLRSLRVCLLQVYKHRPQLVLCNGPGTCIPICAIVLLFKFLGLWRDAKIIFCESFCRVQSLSLSGKLLYYIADEFVVHWPQLQAKHPKCKHLGPAMHPANLRASSSSASSGAVNLAMPPSPAAPLPGFKAPMPAIERMVTVAATQMSCGNPEENIKKAESLVRIASSRGAQIILLQELFQFTYFPIELNASNFQLATSLEESALVQGLALLAKELRVVIPISFFERYRNSYYNSIAVIDADGAVLGVVRKMHIGDRLGYNEKYYFSPSDDPFRVWNTRYGKIGVAVGSDQWYPEVARALVLQGAELLLFPSAMGSNPYDMQYDARDQWQRVMQGHAAANMVPIVASNRVGGEIVDGIQVTFCGSSFITGQTGEMLKIADRESEGVLVESFDLEKFHVRRASWGLVRDRRPHMTNDISTHEHIVEASATMPTQHSASYDRAQSAAKAHSPSRHTEQLAERNGPRRSVYWVKRKKLDESRAVSTARKTSAIADMGGGTKIEYTVLGKYTGDWQEGQKHGYGVFLYANGAKYEGEWVQGKREGRGVYWVEHKKKLRKQYAGEWRDDKREGLGTFFYEDGGRYEGMWRANKREGMGRMVFGADQSVFEGMWLKNERSGQGTLVLANGDRYEGHWLHDKKEGPGRFFYKATKKVYEGEWVDGSPRCGSYHDDYSEAEPDEDLQSTLARLQHHDITHFQLPKLELAHPEQVLSESVAMIRQERVMEAAFHSRRHGQGAEEDDGGEEEQEAQPTSIVFDEETLRLIQREFNLIERTQGDHQEGTISCSSLSRILSALDMHISEDVVLGFLDEVGASYDTLISFAECVDILSLLAETQLADGDDHGDRANEEGDQVDEVEQEDEDR